MKELKLDNVINEIMVNNGTNAQENTPPKKRRNKKTMVPIKEVRSIGRPESDRKATLNLKLRPELKDYLRLRAFEQSHGDDLCTMADVLEELIEKDMKAYYRKKERTEG